MHCLLEHRAKRRSGRSATGARCLAAGDAAHSLSPSRLALLFGAAENVVATGPSSAPGKEAKAVSRVPARMRMLGSSCSCARNLMAGIDHAHDSQSAARVSPKDHESPVRSVCSSDLLDEWSCVARMQGLIATKPYFLTSRNSFRPRPQAATSG